MEIDDSAHLIDLCEDLAGRDASNWQAVVGTLARLRSDPSYVLGLTITLPADPERGPQHNLPIPDFDETGFFGRRDEVRRIKKAIKGAYPVVSILGDGGIGKTSLALKVAYDLLEEEKPQFDAVVWVTAKATILTTHEIQRISGAIEDSLGLFTSAAHVLGGEVAVKDPVAEVLSYLENFRILLLLDNLETVLDGRLREFLLELPLGSKVVVTSRIGLGIENPVSLNPLAEDESVRLLRALARTRGVAQIQQMSDEHLRSLASRMSGHPTYIRWFVSGVQAGRRPEELFKDNELLLDYCMSNVFEFLGEDARAVLRSMQVLAGARNQAELAFLNECTASQIQSALLGLLTTNFVRMSTQTLGTSLDTVYQLSEFGKQYLDKQHPVESDERTWLLGRHEQLVELGARLAADSTKSPYASDTVSVRGPGDIHVARLLREAILSCRTDPAAALASCAEAQGLAPSYYEAWRVEALVRGVDQDHAGACAAYDRALELAPESPVVQFHFGTFLLREAGDPARGMSLLQIAARSAPDVPRILSEIAWGHSRLGNHGEAIASCAHIAQMREASAAEASSAVQLALSCASLSLHQALTAQASHSKTNRLGFSAPETVELLEATVEFVEAVDVQLLVGTPSDQMALLAQLSERLRPNLDDFLDAKAKEYSRRLTERRRQVDSHDLDRRIGSLKTIVPNNAYGFLKLDSVDYFFHLRDMIDPSDWDNLESGSFCAFEPVPAGPKGPHALRVRALRLG
jgi:tetratricopeptide (TPR) repeat protein